MLCVLLIAIMVLTLFGKKIINGDGRYYRLGNAVLKSIAIKFMQGIERQRDRYASFGISNCHLVSPF